VRNQDEAHLVILQYGDYAEGHERIYSGGKENYYAQKYTIDFFTSIASKGTRTTVVTFSRDADHRVLSNGVETCGLELYPKGGRARTSELIELLSRLSPTMLIVVAPIVPVLFWAYRRGLRTLPLFMDSFRSTSKKSKIKHWLLALLLDRKFFAVVANHGMAAAQDLVRIGVDSRKVLPFDWPAVVTPVGRDAKTLSAGAIFRMVYVGQISEAKGVGDIFNALRLLNDSGAGITYQLSLYGRVVDEMLVKDAASLIESGTVVFRGMIDHDQVIEEMAAHDIVIIPSRHEYPEGMPMTIYESFCSRSPLVASDHPMFSEKLVHKVNCMIFPAGSGEGLAQSILELSKNSSLYEAISKNTLAAAAKHFCDLKYHELIDSWVMGDIEKLKAYSLSRISADRVIDNVQGRGAAS